MKVKHNPVKAVWYYKQPSVPDDNRDVLVYLWKPVYVAKNKRLEKMRMMEIGMYNEGWEVGGIRFAPKDIIAWTEIPSGWDE